MRILLSDRFATGGLSSHVVLLARHLVERRHDVTAHVGTGPRASSWPDTGAHVVNEGQLVDLLVGTRFDVVNITDDDLQVLGPRTLASASPVVLSVHATRRRVRVDGVDRVVMYSEAHRTRTRLIGGHPPVSIIPNAIDTRRFQPEGLVEDAGPRPVTLWVGRVSDPRKDVQAYLAAMAGLGPPWRPMIVTDELRFGVTEAFRAEHPDLIVASRSWEQMPALLRGVARGGGCLVMSSRQEGDPLVIGEALACGLPVAAIRIDALEPWIESGALAVAEDADGLTAAVHDAIGPHRAARLAAADRVLHGTRSVERWADAFEQLYTEVAACRRPPVRRWLAAQLAGARRLDRATPSPDGSPTPGPATADERGRLGVVVTTYRRPAALARCLDAVAGLGHQVDAVCVIDNSPDPVVTARPAGLADTTRFEVIGDGTNRGLPAALGQGFDHLRDCRRVLVLDDDTVPTPALLEALHGAIDGGAGLAGLPDPFTLRNNGAGPPRLFGWSPCLLRREVIDGIEPPKARLFFAYDDYEYVKRAERSGWRVEWVRHHLVDRRLVSHWPERSYFAVRNSVWLATRQWPPDAPSWTIAASEARKAITAAATVVRPGTPADDYVRRSARAGAVGFAHGLLGRMGPPPPWVLTPRLDAPAAPASPDGPAGD